jgi:CHAD domain-containing protein
LVSEVVHDRLGDAARRFLDENSDLATTSSAESIHDVRVALRRSRSYLRTFSRLFDTGLAVGISADLKWYATYLGRVRDIDVTSDLLYAEVVELSDTAVWKELEPVLQDRRAAALTALQDCRSVSRYQLVLRHIWMLSDAPMRNRTDLDLRELLKRPWHDYRNSMHAVKANYDALAYHQARIRAKNLRYAAEIAEPFEPTLAKRVVAAGTAVQDHIGALRDAQGALVWLEANLEDAPMSAALVKSLRHRSITEGQVVDASVKRDLQRLAKACRKLRSALE